MNEIISKCWGFVELDINSTAYNIYIEELGFIMDKVNFDYNIVKDYLELVKDTNNQHLYFQYLHGDQIYILKFEKNMYFLGLDYCERNSCNKATKLEDTDTSSVCQFCHDDNFIVHCIFFSIVKKIYDIENNQIYQYFISCNK